jgi:hypothetical protein
MLNMLKPLSYFFLASSLLLAIPRTASSLPTIDIKQKLLVQSNINLPLCFFQTPKGQIVNLDRLCSATSLPPVVISRINTNASLVNGQVLNRSANTVYKVKITYEVLGEDGNIEEQSVDADPPTLYPNQTATFETVIPAGGTINGTFVTWERKD